MSDSNKTSGTQAQFPDYDAEGKPYYRATAGPVEENRIVKLVKIPDAVIPVIFVPGIMGSNLADLNGKSLWLGNGLGSMSGWAFTGAKDRKKELNPAKVRVYQGGEITNTALVKTFDTSQTSGTSYGGSGVRVIIGPSPDETLFGTRESRGWGSVFQMSYGEFLDWLQNTLHDHRVAATGVRHSLINRDLQAELNEEALTEEEVGFSYQYCFPVHAFGYNWLASNKDSAITLNDYINTVIDDYNARGMTCQKVLLVSHSMGGLVSRECSENAGAQQRILGIVHGVMPSIGAAAAYRRMIAGTDGVSGHVLGSDGRQITAVFAQSPGAAQLLPTAEYGVGEANGWLNLAFGEHQVRLPKVDPFTEIYTNRAVWYGLCQDTSINPLNAMHEQPQLDNDWNTYKKMILKDVKDFVEGLKGKYHPITYAFYGLNPGKMDTYNDISWFGEVDTSYQDYQDYQGYQGNLVYPDPKIKIDPTQGSLKYRNTPSIEDESIRTVWVLSSGASKPMDVRYTMRLEDGHGDGTVPVRSGKLPEKNVISQAHFPVEHEGAYKSQEIQAYTLRAIVKIMQQLK